MWSWWVLSMIRKNLHACSTTCANSQGNYQAISTKCLVRHKAEKEARWIKINKKKEKTKEMIKTNSKSERLSKEPDEVNSDLDMENNDWARSPSASPLSLVGDLECPDNKNRW